jgi:uncharacterized LabA/DUF88 family protein
MRTESVQIHPERTNFAAVLIDFENVFYFLKNNIFKESKREVTDLIIELIRALNVHLLTVEHESVISMDAYADFDRIQENAQSQLYLLGAETHNVLGTETKNAADMKLCIDTLDIFYNRNEIGSFVFVAGDRDYIPVIQYLKKRGRKVRVVGFPKSTSGDLVLIVGQENFISAERFISLPEPKPVAVSSTAAKVVDVHSSAAAIANSLARPAVPARPPATAFQRAIPAWLQPFDELGTDLEKYEPDAVRVALEQFPGKPEIWLVPYLHKLRGQMPELTEAERKRIITNLEQKGAFKVEKRKGETNDYSVIKVNWNSQAIRDLSPG